MDHGKIPEAGSLLCFVKFDKLLSDLLILSGDFRCSKNDNPE